MNVGETIFSAVLQALFQQLLSPDVIRGFFSLFEGSNLPKTIKDCKIQLLFLDKFLRDAEKKQFDDEFVKEWLAELQGIAYDMEDILDELATDAQLYDLKNKALALEDDVDQLIKDFPDVFGSSSNNMVTNFIGSTAESLSTLFNSGSSFQSRLDGIIKRLQGTRDLAQSYGMQQHTPQKEISQNWRETGSLLSKPEVYGREKNKEEIITQLLKDEQINENFAVIPIVGKGGIGKTTLAQYVYNDEQVNSHFDCRAWMCVSDVFDVKGITTTIFKAVNPGAVANFSTLNEAQENLKQVLTGKKFLIVLDDVWNLKYDEWDTLQAPFQCGKKGSRVIMTTRIEESARTMGNNPTHNEIISLNGLSDDDCWLVFQQHYANNGPDLAEWRDDIVEKCKGLPLAAKALGGLLKSKRDRNQCRKILDSDIWREESSVLPVLRLSYHHLPSYLKRVFAYCSVFPKDYKYGDEMELVLLWMAQGFLPENSRASLEDIGCEYFDDLVSRSLLEHNLSDGGGFIMHDLIHDLAECAAGDICSVTTDTQRNCGRIRHLLLGKHCSVEALGNQPLDDSQLLRTFIYDNEISDIGCADAEILDYVPRLKHVRSLKLCFDEIEELPDLFCGLKHLRLLSLSVRKMKVLPKSISKLYNLQTLDLFGCEDLEEVPNISLLVNLRHLKIDDNCLMPLGIGKLTNLQTLDRFRLAARGGSRVRELKNLNHLYGSLEIRGLGNVMKVEDAQEAQLDKKTSLEKLFLVWEDSDVADDNTARDVVEQLQPPSSIEKCQLSGYKGLTLPCWLGDPSFKNMVDIALFRCDRCEYFPPLGQLPKLESLCIERMRGIKQVGREFYGSCPTPFPALKDLSFGDMDSWEKWEHSAVDNSRAFTRLEVLRISNCKSLQGSIPPHLPSLKDLGIRKCPKIKCFPEGGLPKNLTDLCIYETKIEQPVQEWGLHLCNSLRFLKLKYVGSSANSVEHIPCPGFSLPSSLHKFKIQNFQNLKTISSHSTLPNLTALSLRHCPNLESLFVDHVDLASLTQLEIGKCPNFRFFPKICLFKNLRQLVIHLTSIENPIKEWGLHLLTSLDLLILEHVGSSSDTIECTSDLHLPSSLESFFISGFKNLKTIHCSNLPKLSRVRIWSCPKFESFGDNGLPSQLKRVDIRMCDILQQKLRSDPQGRIWIEDEKYSLF